MIGYDFDQRLSLTEINAETEAPSHGARPPVELTDELLSRLGLSGDNLEQQLEELKSSDPGMFRQILGMLQGTAGNQAVNGLTGGGGGGGERSTAAQAFDLATSQGSAADLPNKAELEAGFGKSLGNLDFITGPAAAAANDMVDSGGAFAVGNKIVSKDANPDIQILAEEVAHTLQQGGDSKKTEEVSGDLKITSPTDTFETEAASLAATVAAGGHATETSKTGGEVIVARFFGGLIDTVESWFSNKPDNISLNIGGANLTFPMPDSDSKNITLDTSRVRSPIPGVELKGGRVSFNDDWEMTGGSLQVSISAGDFISMDNVSLNIGRGGSVNASINGAQFQVGDLINGTIDLNLGAGGVSGRATIESGQITLPGGLTISSGSLAASLQNGNVSANGSLVLEVEGLGTTIDFNAQVNNTDVSGSLTASLNQPIQPVEGFSVNSASITGSYQDNQFAIGGDVNLSVADWANISAQGTYNWPSGLWDATAQLEQGTEKTFGGLTVSNTVVSAVVKDSQFQGVRATGTFSIPNFEGNVDCAYDVPANKISGTGSLRMTEPLEVGPVKIKAAGGTLTVTDNVLVKAEGAVQAELPFQDQPTFDVIVEKGVYLIQEQKFSGTGRVSTLRDLTFGNPTGLRAEVKSGAAGEAVMADNTITSFNTGIDFTVHDAEGQFATGNVAFDYANQSSVNGSATFTLDADYGVPDRVNGPGFLKQGSSIKATVSNGALDTIQLSNAAMEVNNTGGTGKVVAKLSGTWDFPQSQLDAEGSAEFTEPWQVVTPWATVTLGPADAPKGQITTKVEQNQIKKLDGQLPFDTQIPFQGQNIDIRGLVKGEFNAETLTVSGSIEASPKSKIDVTFPDRSKLSIKPETTIKATIGNSQLEQMEFGLSADYDSAGTRPIKLKLDVPNATYVLNQGFTGIGKVSLREDYKVDVIWAEGGEITLKGGEGGSNIEASLTNNNLDHVKGQIPYAAKMKIQNVDVEVDGKIDGTYKDDTVSGKIDANISKETTIPIAAIGGSIVLKPATKIDATIGNNTLENLGFNLDAEYHRDSNPKLKVGVQITDASYDPALGFSGEGSAKLIDKCEITATWGSVTLTEGGQGLNAKITSNKVDYIKGDIPFEATIQIQNKDVNLDGCVKGEWNGETQKVSGDVDAKLTNEPVFEPDGFSTVQIKNGTSLKAHIGDSELENVKFNLKADYQRSGEPFLTPLKVALEMNDVTYDKTKGISGNGGIKISENTEIRVPWGEGGKITLKGGAGGSSLTGEVKEGAIEKIEGKLPFLAEITVKGEKIGIDGTVDGSYQKEGNKIAGQLDAKLTTHPELNLGTLGKLQLLEGTSARATVANSELTEVKFTLKADYANKNPMFTPHLKVGIDIPDASYTTEQGGSFSGNGSMKLTDNCTLSASWGDVTLKGGETSLSGELVKTELTKADGKIGFEAGLNLFGDTRAEIEGNVDAQYRGAEGGADFGGTIDAKLKSPLTIAAPEGGSEFVVGTQTTVKATIGNKALENVEFNLVADYTQTGGVFQGDGLQLHVELNKGSYSPEEGFGGSGALTLNSDCDILLGQTALKIKSEGSNVNGVVAKSSLESLTGNLGFEAGIPVGSQTAQIHGTVENAGFTKPDTLSGTVTATLKNELNFNTGDATVKVMPETTTVTASLSNKTFNEVKFGLHAKYQKPADGQSFLTPLKLDAKITDGVYNEQTGVSGKGTIALEEACDLKAGERVKLTLKSGSGISAEMKDNDLKNFDGNVQFNSEITINPETQTVAKVDGNIEAHYLKEGGAASFNGQFDAQVTEDFDIASGENTFKVKGGQTNAKAKLDGSDLSEVKFNLTAEYTRSGAPFDEKGLKLEVKLTEAGYDKAKGVSGDGSITLMQATTVQFGDKIKVVLKEGGASAKVDQNDLKEFKGGLDFDMTVAVPDNGDLALGGQFNAEYKKEGEAGTINGDIDAALKAPFTIGQGEQQLELKAETTNMKATLSNGALGTVTANLDADYRHSGQPFSQPLDLNIKLENAIYDHTKGQVSGDGSMKLNGPCTVTAGEHSLTLKNGSGITTHVEENTLKTFNGDIGFEAAIKVANATAQIDGTVKADYTSENGGKFGGSFDAAVKNNFTLGEGTNQLTVKKDTTNIKATLAENDLTEITFNLDADYVRQPGGAFISPMDLNIKLENATYTKASQTVSGAGSISLNQNCDLKAGEGNKLTLKQSSGISATVTNNDLETFNGSIDYAAEIKLKDQKAQVSGNASLNYQKAGESGTVSGSISGKLDNSLTFGPENNKITVLNDDTNLTATVANNAFEGITLNMHANYLHKSSHFGADGLDLDLKLENATYDAQQNSVGGTGTIKLNKDAKITAGENTVNIKAEKSILRGVIGNNELETFTGRVYFDSKLKIGGQDVEIEGNIAADYSKDAGFGGEVFAKLAKDVPIVSGDTTLTIKNDATDIKATFANNNFESLKLNLHAHYDQKGDSFDPAQFLKLDMRIADATYADDKISGTGSISLREACKIKVNQDGSTNVTLKSGSLNGTIAESKLTSATGNLQFESEIKIKEGSVLQVEGGLSATYTNTGATPEISGAINANVKSPCQIIEGSHDVTVLTDTYVNATLTKGEFEGVKFGLHAEYKYTGGADTLYLDLRLADAGYVPGEGFSGTGSIELKDDYTVALGENEGTLKIGSVASATVASNKLTNASGDLLFAAKIKVGDKDVKIDGQITGELDNSKAEPKISGSAKAQIAEAVEFTIGTNKIKILTDTNIRASVTNNSFDEVKFDLHAHTTHEGSPFSAQSPLLLDIQLKDVGYSTETGFGGSGSIALRDDCTITVGENTFTLLKEGTSASGEIKDSSLEKLTGSLAFESEVKVQGTTIAIKGGVQGSYDKATGHINGSAEASVKETTQPIQLGSAGTLVIFNDTSIRAEVKDSKFDNMNFTLHAEFARTDSPAIVVDINAAIAYDKTTGFSGRAAAEVKSDRVELLTMGSGESQYTLLLLKGTGASVTLDKNELTEVAGSVNLMLTDSKGDFIKAGVTADYKVKDNKFSGTGNAEVVNERELGKVGSGENLLTLFIEKGSGVNIDVQNSKLQSIGGAVKIRANDPRGPFIRVTLQGTFDAAGGSGFTGTGQAEILNEKRLVKLGDYEFWIQKGTGATVSLEKNALKEVGGTINFLVKNKDDKGTMQPFIEGSVTGNYKAEDGKFSGSGEVKLARDMEFNVSSTTKIKFLKGSGGGGSVKDNELEKLTGTLKAVVCVDNEDYVKVEAAGEYDAINNKLVYLDGSAELLKPIELFGGKVIISKLSGNARIENNELVRAGGSAAIEVPGIQGFTIRGGVDNFLWRSQGGQDFYSGTGWVEIEKEGLLKGRVDVKIFENGDFDLEGMVELTLNKMIKGSINIKMDQTFNPIVGGKMEVEVELMKARDIFSFYQKLFEVKMNFAAGPVPCTVQAGAAFGFKVSTQPVMFNGAIEIANFKPLEANLPDFGLTAGITTGLTAKAEFIPWVSLGIGVGGLLSAGLKLKGILSATAAADLGLSISLAGGPDGIGGSLGVDLGLSISAALSVVPQVYAEFLGMKVDKDIYSFDFELGELFSWDWGTSYDFGNPPASMDRGQAAKTQATGTQNVTQDSREEDATGELASEFGSAKDPGKVEDGPELESAEEMKNSTDASKKQEEEPKDDKFSKMMKIAGAVGEIAGVAGNLMRVIGNAVNVLMIGSAIPIPFGGVIAAGLYIAYEIISGGLDLGEVKNMFVKILEIAQMLIDEGIIVLPAWLQAIVDFLGRYSSVDAAIGALIDAAADWLCEKFPSWKKVIRRAAGALKGIVNTVVKLIKAIINGITLKDLLEILGSLGGAVLELIGAVAEMIGEAVMETVKAVGEALGSLGRGLVNLAGAVLDAIADAAKAVWKAVTSW